MENNDIPLGNITYHRKNWKKAYLNMRGWAVILAITTILFAIGFSYAVSRPRIIQPNYIDITTEK